jgi:hypothetical protein
MRRAIPLIFVAIGGCAYYNGIYNAKASAKTADRQFDRGESYAAEQAYLLSAATAETVLVRHPKTHWRPEALYLAARGAALAGECPHGLRRLEEYLAIEGEPRDRRERALLAKAACLIKTNHVLSGDTILAPLLESGDNDVRADAAFWAGRGAMLLGDVDRAQALLAKAPGSAAAWEFLAAALQRGDMARAESLLVIRAEEGDWRPEVREHVRALWSAGRADGATRIVDLYGKSGASPDERVRLRFILSDLAAASGDTALARIEAIEAQRTGIATVTDADARARIIALNIRQLDLLPDIQTAIARDSLRAAGSPILKRLRDNVTMINLFLSNPNYAGAHLFLAAEIARDSLRAYKLAHALFRAIERDYGDYEIAARALLAARALYPDSSKVYEDRVLTKWDSSSAAFALKGLDPTFSTKRGEDGELRKAWNFFMTQWSDTLRERRRQDSIAAAASGVRRQ